VSTDAPTGPTVNWTTEPVELPGVAPVDPPSEMVQDRLWHGGVPVDYVWVRDRGIDTVVDLADADSFPPSQQVDGISYLKCPLVDGDELPDQGLTTRLADLVAGLVEDGHRVLVHCTFGRNRSGLLVSLVVRRLLGLTGEEAVRYVQERRQGAVNNETFNAWLSSLPALDGSSAGSRQRVAPPGDLGR